MSSSTILPRSFYERDTLCVAKDLLGKVLKFADYYGVINEVEAYVEQDDPACHAVRGCTPRTAVMFGAAGFSYVYLIYGMYHCLNIVTEREGFPAAVLIRGIELEKPTVLSLDGPGKLCKRFNITKNNNQFDLTQFHNFCVYDSIVQPEYIATPRIGKLAPINSDVLRQDKYSFATFSDKTSITTFNIKVVYQPLFGYFSFP